MSTVASRNWNLHIYNTEEREGTEHHKMKNKIQNEYKRRIKLLLKSELKERNKMVAINMLAVPVVTYSYTD